MHQPQQKKKLLKPTTTQIFPPKHVPTLQQKNHKRERDNSDGISLKNQIKKQCVYPLEPRKKGNPLPKILTAMQQREKRPTTAKLQREVTRLTQSLDSSSKNARTRGALRKIATSMDSIPTYDVALTPNGKTSPPS